jgi:hypothetical protein
MYNLGNDYKDIPNYIYGLSINKEDIRINLMQISWIFIKIAIINLELQDENKVLVIRSLILMLISYGFYTAACKNIKKQIFLYLILFSYPSINMLTGNLRQGLAFGIFYLIWINRNRINFIFKIFMSFLCITVHAMFVPFIALIFIENYLGSIKYAKVRQILILIISIILASLMVLGSKILLPESSASNLTDIAEGRSLHGFLFTLLLLGTVIIQGINYNNSTTFGVIVIISVTYIFWSEGFRYVGPAIIMLASELYKINYNLKLILALAIFINTVYLLIIRL